MYACDYLEQGVLNTLRGIAFTAPSKCYLALYISDPGETGSAGTEVSYAGYKRMEVDFSVPADISGGIGIQNQANITFATPEQAAGTVTHIGVLDSLSGGNMLARGAMTEPLSIGAGQPPVILAGDALFYLTGNMSKEWKKKVLNVFRGQSIPAVTSPCFALWNGSPEDGGAELTGENYARVALTFAAPEEQPSGQVVIKNSTAVSFHRLTTTWGTWSWSAVCSAASGGETIFCKAVDEPMELKKGYMPTIAENAVELGLN